jgi:hypothetical protein
MFDSHASPPARPSTPIAPKKNIARAVATSDAACLEGKIRERAYQLYEGRRCVHGQDQQDWAQAEHEILNQRRR